jgi:hypothetical protein
MPEKEKTIRENTCLKRYNALFKRLKNAKEYL